ncbi:hypothetical protein PLICRDRAFT_375701 [Plicaturopsis crispa FD-325 SS-3]|uniref:Uncharacterized protein n=1 Tax=Plicaturopsis crispa FD-325 SS-3 TaxID=944288 RepID=A0A0C9SXB2_PLICR|nr:hypothetical protein PLICRDRAFT_375701 [Plicaturopsis crispa FD-325 SS-3]
MDIPVAMPHAHDFHADRLSSQSWRHLRGNRHVLPRKCAPVAARHRSCGRLRPPESGKYVRARIYLVVLGAKTDSVVHWQGETGVDLHPECDLNTRLLKACLHEMASVLDGPNTLFGNGPDRLNIRWVCGGSPPPPYPHPHLVFPAHPSAQEDVDIQTTRQAAIIGLLRLSVSDTAAGGVGLSMERVVEGAMHGMLRIKDCELKACVHSSVTLTRKEIHSLLVL